MDGHRESAYVVKRYIRIAMTSNIASRKTVPDREDYRKTFILQKYIQELPLMENSSQIQN